MYNAHQQTVRRGSLDFYGLVESEILNLTYKKAFPTEQILKPMWTDYLIRWFLAKKKDGKVLRSQLVGEILIEGSLSPSCPCRVINVKGYWVKK